MTARPPFMSDAPTPHTVSPSTLGTSLSPGGTVSRCPASTRRCPRPRSVRATTLSPTRSTSSQVDPASVFCTRSASGASRPLTEGTAISSVVTASRSRIGSGAGAVVPQDLGQLRLVMALSLAEPLDHQHARHEELPPGILAAAARPDGDAPRRHDAARDLLARLGVEDRDGRVEKAARPEDRPLADAGPAGHHAAA